MNNSSKTDLFKFLAGARDFNLVAARTKEVSVRFEIVLITLLCIGFTTGCLTVYQPLSGLHRPIAIDTRVANFSGQALTIHCVPEKFLSRKEASALCRKLQVLFENQGAKVTTASTLQISDEGLSSNDNRVVAPLAAPGPTVVDKSQPPSSMTLKIQARQIHRETNPMLWTLSALTFTLFPAISEYTFVQDITIRDASGFLLLSDSLKAKFTRYFGLSTYFGNIALDWFREESNKLSGNRVKTDFSDDFYPQISQLVFNAKMRARVLLESKMQAHVQ